MATEVRMFLIADGSRQREGNAVDLENVHWVRQVDSFPAQFTVEVHASLHIYGKAAISGPQVVKIVASGPGERQPFVVKASADFGTPEDHVRNVHLKVPITFTVTTPGERKLRLLHQGVQLAHCRYRVLQKK